MVEDVKPEVLVKYSLALCEQLAGRQIGFRLFGSCAIALKCGEDSAVLRRAGRWPKDIDAVITHQHLLGLRTVLRERGWREDVELTAQTDGMRLRFWQPQDHVALDVCVDVLAFAQRLDLRATFEADWPTISAADLLLSKLQIPTPMTPDVIDCIALLAAMPIRSEDDAGINLARLQTVVAASWCWHHAVGRALEHLRQAARSSGLRLTLEEQGALSEKLALISEGIASAPKSLLWRCRAAFGEWLPWRKDVDAGPTLG